MRGSAEVEADEDDVSLAEVGVSLCDDGDAVVIGAAESSESDEQPAAKRSADAPSRAAVARRVSREYEYM